MTFIYPIILFVVAFLLRYSCSFLFGETQVSLSDLPFHGMYFKKVKEYKFYRILTNIDKLAIDNNKLHRPFLLYNMVAVFFSYKQFLRYNKYINSFLDACFNVLLYYVFCFFLKQASFGGDCSFLAMFVCFFYISSPLLTFFSPRFICFGTRHFSFIVLMLSFIFQVAYLSYGGWMFFLLAGLFSLVSFYSAQFSIQASIFIPVIVFIFLRRWEIMFFAFFGVLFPFLLTPNWSKNFLKKKINHFSWYMKNLKNNSAMLSIYKIYPKQLFFHGNIFFIVICVFIFDSKFFIDDLLNKNMLIYSIASLLVSLIVALPYSSLRIFGEAIRYCEYFVIFSSYLLCVWCLNNGYLFVLFIYILFLLVFYFFHMLKSVSNKIDTHLPDVLYTKELISFLNNYSEKVVSILPFPGGSAYAILQGCKNKVVTPIGISSDYLFFTKNIKNIPWAIRSDISFIHRKYPFDWIVFEKNAQLMAYDYELENYPIMFENKRYVVYEY